MQMSFGALELAERLKRDNVLMRVDALIGGRKLHPRSLQGLQARVITMVEEDRTILMLLFMFKSNCWVWHKWLYRMLCWSKRCVYRIDFQFCGLSLSDAIPDKTTLCRFRNSGNDNRLERIACKGSINEQLQSHGLMIKGATGAVIDATLIESAARPAEKSHPT